MGTEPARIVRSIFIGIALFFLITGVILIVFSHSFFDIPRIVPGSSSSDNYPVPVSHSFRSGNGSYTVTIAINSSVYADAKNTSRSMYLIRTDINTRYYLAMMNDPTQETIYRDLTHEFRNIRSQRNLTDDEYVELMTAYVQSLPYSDVGNAPPKYPAELLAEGKGDCDDKSILLAGLLSREGYPVALLKFGPENHMALGIGSDAYPYKKTGYTYIEAMTPAYIGAPSFYIQEKQLLHSDPFVIPLSSGTKIYRSGNETNYIENMYLLSNQRYAEITRTHLQILITDQNSTENAMPGEDGLRYAAIREYIQNNPNDRRSVVEYLKREMPA